MPYENIKEQFGALGLKGMLQYFDDMIDLKSPEEWPQMLISMLLS
jgi:hypothetical protein